MIFRNKNNDSDVRNLKTINTEFKEFRIENPESFSASFTFELYSLILDTLNGRNDFRIENMTETEINSIIRRLAKKIYN